MREVLAKILRTGGARFYGVALGVITLALTARWLGPSGRGELAAITTWATALATIFCLSLGQVALHRAARLGRDWLSGSFAVLSSAAVVGTGLAWLTMILLYVLSEGSVFGSVDPRWLALGMLLVPLMLWEQYGSALLQALQRLDIYNRYQVYGRSASVGLVVLLILGFGFGIEGVLLANIAGQLVIAIGGLTFLVRMAGGLRRARADEVNEFVAGGLKLHLNTLGVFLFTAVDVLMLNYYRSAAETGFYQLGVQLMGVLMILPQAAAMVISGKVAQLGATAAWDVHRRVLGLTLLAMLAVALVAALSVDWWLVLLAGDEFAPAAGIFRWQLLAVLGMTFSVVMAPQWIGRGYFWQASALTVFVGLANVVANALLIPRYGMYGAVWASLGVYSVAVLGNGLMALHCELDSRRSRTEGVTA